MATASLPRNRWRWWLWWPLLAVLAWLVAQEQAHQNEAGSPSLASNPAPNRARVAQPVPAPTAGATALALMPREQLLAASGAKAHPTQRDLFVSRHPTPATSAPLTTVADVPSAPALPFRYVGKQWDGEAWEVYAVSGHQTYVLREGLMLDEQYRVDRIAPPHAALTYLPLGTVQNLSIGDTR